MDRASRHYRPANGRRRCVGRSLRSGHWSPAGEPDEQQLMDLVFTVGAYEVLAMALKSFGVQLDPDLR